MTRRPDNEIRSSLERTRHSLAHLLAAAVLEEFPNAQLAIGPAIEDGFYYDILFPRPITPPDLPRFAGRMRALIAAEIPFRQTRWSKEKARRFFAKQPFKKELIAGLPGRTVGISRCGAFTDLCRGVHVKNTREIHPEAFTLHSMAGAYWRGDEKNPMLTRVYGLAFETKEQLEQHLRLLAEAKRRDHKILGARLGLFLFHETSPGSPYWLPNGMTVINELLRFWREQHVPRGYQEIATPLVNKKELWETSGHWEFYREDMFLMEMGSREVYGLKPMNCPNAMVVFGATPRSYRDLPLRLSDTDILHRYERSGTLNGLLRARSFRQDDAHNFVREQQIAGEFRDILAIARTFYSTFDLPYRLRLGTRPVKFLGDRQTWNRAETALKKILAGEVGKKNVEILDGDGAFYGPKVDIIARDALGREWQMGTIQLDFQQPRRFGLTYTDERGKKRTPVVIHRAVFGSLDRFLGIILEHFAGALPFWLAPVHVAILPVNERVLSYAREAAAPLRERGLRVTVDDRNESVGKKIRDAELKKIPVLGIVGAREQEQKTISLRFHGGTDGGTRTLQEAGDELVSARDERRLKLS